MKRARHRWGEVFLIGVFLLLVAPSSDAVRATSLIFGKTTSTAAPQDGNSSSADEGIQVETASEETNATQAATSKYSGIPQIDYIYDPNLPRELNGYNLSEYPFYETVPKPETMDFKCDGLHDGFYASVPHKCQVYHHCLFGVRYDFLCANYTAFDQKTFICHFVSEVDCKNSPNYFSRNEALYKAASTSPPPPPPTTSTTTTPAPPPPPARPGPRHRYRYDYYDDDYYYPARDDYYDEERPRRRQRPQARPGRKRRPYEDYDEDRYNRRPIRPRDEPTDEERDERRSQDRSRPGVKRPERYHPDSRRTYDDDQDNRRPYHDRPRERRPFRSREESTSPEEPKYDRRFLDDQRKSNEEETKIERDKIRPREGPKPRGERPKDERKTETIRPRDENTRLRDDSRREEKPSFRPREESRFRDDNRRFKEDRPYRNRDNMDRRPLAKTEITERPRQEEDDNYDDNYQEKRNKPAPTAPEGTTLVKPSGHSIYSQPRAPPKIKRPVPATEKDKYNYQMVTTTTVAPKQLGPDDYYDEYEEEDTSRPSSSAKNSAIQQKPKFETIEREKFRPSRPHQSSKAAPLKRPTEYEYDYYYEQPMRTSKQSNQPQPQKLPQKSSIIDELEYEDDYEVERVHKDKRRELPTNPPRTNLDEGYPTAPAKDITSRIKDVRTNVKIIKRPFLPSRGGSPYLPRGLQPVAGKNLSATTTTTPKPTTTSTTTTTTSTTTTTTTTSTTTEKPITTTEKVTTTEKPSSTTEEEYEYYDEEDIVDYDTTNQPQVVVTPTTQTTVVQQKLEETKTEKPLQGTSTATDQPELTTILQLKDDHSKELADKVFKIYKQNYEAIKGKLDTTEGPGDYRPKLEDIFNPQTILNQYDQQPRTQQKPYERPQPNPEISKPYTATGKPLFPENISIKQNLADSIENDYDVTINEALTPTLANPPRNVPSGFLLQSDRDFGFSRFRNNFNFEPQYSASELSSFRKRPNQISGVSIRTPQSYFIQPNSRLPPVFGLDEGAQRLSRPGFRQEDNVHRPTRTIVYRQVPLGDFVF